MAAAGVRRAGGRFHARAAGGRAFYGRDGGRALAWRALAEVSASASASAPAVDAPATAAAGREPAPPAGAAASAMAARITPAVLFVTVVLAVVLLVSGLLHVLRRLFLKSHGGHGGAAPGERGQLQHLFFPAQHDDGAGGSGGSGGGLAQAAIDALPEFAYAELSGAAPASSSRKGKEKAARPFDCAVCLCEFAAADRLRLLPLCGHAFHAACIDVWLRSTATCPLCRTKLSARHIAAATADADAPSSAAARPDDLPRDQDQPGAASGEAASVVLPVRLGRFDSTDGGPEAGTSSRIGDGRRCYSMGSYQYVLADDHLLVSVHLRHGASNAGGAGTTTAAAAAATEASGDQQQGKKVFARGDSFSVSKIWQWRGGDRRLVPGFCADDAGLPWAPAAKDDQASSHTKQQSHTSC